MFKPAAVGATGTIFPTRVVDPDHRPVLKPGWYNQKLGGLVTKGRWNGLPIFSLTLEERYTCPQTCQHWHTCYGNNMNWAKRYRAGPDLEAAIARDLDSLSKRFPAGFVVRLHILGDFYDLRYANLWAAWAAHYPTMKVFGYTAHTPDSPIGRVMAEHFPHIRFSGVDTRTGTDGLVCPEQTGKTESCGTCGLCWSTSKVITFKEH